MHSLKNTSLFFLLLSVLLSSCNSFSEEAEDDIGKIISGMTLEEKVGQMTNLTLPVVSVETDSTVVLDTVKLYDALVTHHVGSFQNVGNRAYDLSDWHYIVSSMQKMTLEKTRHKIPFLYCIDAVHGANYINGATLFPHNTAMAATRNTALAERCGAITAAQTRASGVRYTFSPVLDAGRNQQWSRFGETFGEDVYIVSQMGTAVIRGYEGKDPSQPDKVAACMKHYIGYSVPENGRDRAPAYIPEIVLREYFLPPFREAVKTGAHTLMVNSGEVNGVPVHASKYLLTDVLRNELEFKGVVITDWQDVLKLHERHRVAESHKEAVFLAVEAGIDMCIVPFDYSFSNDLIALVKEGRISEGRINESVRRILELKKAVGLFKNPEIEQESVKLFSNPEYTQVAYQSAAEAITLLKNEGQVLPLSVSKKVLVTGPAAHTLSALHGAWSYSWQGDNEKLYPDSLWTIEERFRTQKNNSSVKSVVFGKEEWNKSGVLAEAKKADVILLCLGEKPYAETPGHVQDLALDANQVELVKEISKAGKPIVLVLIEGRPRIIREIEPYCQSILLAYWPGSQGANALYDIVYGKYNPGGKLPFTYPRYSGTLQTYDHKLLDEAVEEVKPYKYYYEFNPQFPFGHGLSYTTYSYSDMNIPKKNYVKTDTIKISVRVKNAGKYTGYESIELYSRDLYASITPSVRRLRRFSKIHLMPGEEKTVIFSLPVSDLSFINASNQPTLEEGIFELTIKNLKSEIKIN